MIRYYFCHETTIGRITICANARAITKLHFDDNAVINAENTETNIITKAFLQLREYLNGSRKKFDIKLEYTGTEFQLVVFDQLKGIRYGKTKTYKEIACRIHNPQSSMASGEHMAKIIFLYLFHAIE